MLYSSWILFFSLLLDIKYYSSVLVTSHVESKSLQNNESIVFSPINGHCKRWTPLISGQFFLPAEFWSKSHKKLSKRRTGN